VRKEDAKNHRVKHYFSDLCADAEALAQALRPCEKTQRTLRLKDFDFLDTPVRKESLNPAYTP